MTPQRARAAVRDLALIAAVSLAVRWVTYVLLPAIRYDALPVHQRWYFETLHDRLPEYVAFTMFRPPVTYLVQGATVAVAGPAAAYDARAFLLVTFALDILAVLLLYVAARRLGAHRGPSMTAAVLTSLALVPWELWRDGAHYDHLTVPLAASFAAAAVIFVTRPALRSAILLGAVGAVYVAQSPAALYAVPLAGVAAAALAPGLDRGRRVLTAVIAMALPLTAAAPIVARNAAEARSFATGNQGGPAIMLLVHEAIKDQADPAAMLFTGDRAPSWYRWCYERATPPSGTEHDPSWIVLSRAFGICFPFTAPDAPTWPFDLSALRAELERSADRPTRVLVDRDIADMRDRRYLFAGFSPEQSPRWIGVYGAESQRVALDLFVRRPDLTARALAIAGARYVRYGPFLPYRVTLPPAENGMRTQAAAIPLEPLFRAAALGSAGLTLVGLAVLPFAFARAVVAVARRRALQRDRSALVLAVPTTLVSGVVLLGAWDLDRYFMQVFPYVTLVGIMAASSEALPPLMKRSAKRALVGILGEPGTASTFSPDADPRALAASREAVLSRKPALRRELARRDAEIHRAIDAWADVPGPVAEIGAGVSPVSAPPGRRVVHSDTYREGGVELLASAAALPFRRGSLAAVVGIHVLHHLPDPLAALREALAAVRPGGAVVLVEPNHNLLSRIVFGVFHPERFDPSQREWRREPFPDTDANQATAWIIFERDRDRLRAALPRLRVVESRPIASLGSLLTGGFLLRQLAPDAAIDLVARAASRPPLLGWLAIHRIIVLKEMDA